MKGPDQMTQCKKEMMASGATVVPRTCPLCRLGPCVKGHDASVFTNADLVFAGRRNGMNEQDESGSYISFILAPDSGGTITLFKINETAAKTLAKMLSE